MICTSCAQGGTVSKVASKLMPGVTLYLCRPCSDRGLEPRHIIILTARKSGLDAVAGYIKNRKYLGDEIVATELV